MWKVFPCHGFIIVHWHDDVIKWKHFPRYWPFVRGNHQPTINSPHKGQWRGALMFSLISVWTNGWVNNREPGDMRRYRAHCDVTVMCVNFTFRRWQLPPYYHWLYHRRHARTNPIYRHIMMTSANGNIFRVTGPLWGEPPATGGSLREGGSLMISLVSACTKG